MKPIEPLVEGLTLARGWRRTNYAEDQPEYMTLPSLKNVERREGPVVSVWELDPGEVALMRSMLDSHAAGGPTPKVCLTMWTFHDPLQPVRMEVGGPSEPYRSDTNDVRPPDSSMFIRPEG